MGIKVEYNPDLALRDISKHENGNRQKEECIPADMQVGEIYDFLKCDHRNYWLFGEIPLLETKGSEELSRPRASIIILEATHFVKDNKPFTRGKYKVVEVFKDDKIHFEGFDRVGAKKF